MKKTQLILATMFFAAVTAATAADTPTPATPGNGRGCGAQATKGCGQRTGPRDGSGPIHTPGTGGGANGNGKATGPRDGSGPIHTPGTGGGTGAGMRRGRR
jgi:hypothetical protein